MIFMPTKFVDKFAKKIDRSTDKFGFLGHSNSKICAQKIPERKKLERIFPAIQLPERPGSGDFPAPREVRPDTLAGKSIFMLPPRFWAFASNAFLIPRRPFHHHQPTWMTSGARRQCRRRRPTPAAPRFAAAAAAAWRQPGTGGGGTLTLTTQGIR